MHHFDESKIFKIGFSFANLPIVVMPIEVKNTL